ncbi:MAG: hypothetical protein GY782_08465 [Gammaproteobacteria bacterium]|nr:hypothetical protein [Gammaproteobacteria bacterium]
MEILVKVGDKWPEGHPNHEKGWRDGQIIDIRPDGYYQGKVERRSHTVISIPGDYWELRGSTDWKSTLPSVYELKKKLSVADASGKYRWEKDFNELTVPERKRDRFIDFKALQDKGKLTQAQYNDIYDKGKEIPPTTVNETLDSVLKNEDTDIRKPKQVIISP